jgi:hypothetical protein
MTFDQYIAGLMETPLLHWRPPKDSIRVQTSGIENGGQIVSVVMDRCGQFQAEFFVLPVSSDRVLSHVHPDVDAVQLFVSGDLSFRVEEHEERYQSLGQKIGESYYIAVPQTAHHSAVAFGQGGSFFTFQAWKDGITPTTIGDKFELHRE